MTTNNAGWIPLNEAAKYLGLNRESLYRWAKKKGFPAYKLGGAWRCKVSEIDDWVRKQKAMPPTARKSPNNVTKKILEKTPTNLEVKQKSRLTWSV